MLESMKNNKPLLVTNAILICAAGGVIETSVTMIRHAVVDSKMLFDLLTPIEARGICHMDNMALTLLLAVAFLMQSCRELAFKLRSGKDPYRPHALKLSANFSSHNVLDPHIYPNPCSKLLVFMLSSCHTTK
jgi:hypothetical protein